VRALTARRPAARYVVGGQARLGLALLPHMPSTLRERILMSSLNLDAEAFDVRQHRSPPRSA